MLTSLDDVQRGLGRPFAGSAEAALADDLVRAIEAAITILTGLELVTEPTTRTVTIDGIWGPELRLPQTPVRSVLSVSRGGMALSPASYAWNATGALLSAVGTWGGPWIRTTVEFVFGWDATDPTRIALTRWVADRAVALMRQSTTNPDNVRSESLGSYSVTYSAESLVMAASTLTGQEGEQVLRILGRPTGLYSIPMVKA